MSHFISIMLAAIGLSMDAFSFALLLGTTGFNRRVIIKSSLIVGIFHFLMPLLSDLIGEPLLKALPIESSTIAGIIFLGLSIEMIYSSLKDYDNRAIKPINTFMSMIIFAFTVSLDSFSVGVGLSAISDHHVMAALTFMIISCIFTMAGLILGKKLKRQFGNYATVVGAILLFILALNYIL